jgi:hypothetical protein
MSTTSNGAFSPVERRMIPSGSVASGEPAGGVVHPFTQVAEGAPWVFGGLCGSAGCVGVGSVDVVVVGVGAVVVGLAEIDREGVEAADTPPGASPSQATSRNAAASSATERAGRLRIG